MHKGVLNIFSHQRNANQNDTKIPFQPSHIHNHQERIKNVSEDREEKKLLYSVGGNVNFSIHYRNQSVGS
jgi:hypothetical protein